MKQYHDLLRRVLNEGTRREDRTGTGTIGIFGHQMEFDLTLGFPLLTTKKIHTKSVFGELIWFLKGETNIKWLNDRDIHIWDEWADSLGQLGPVYGSQWRAWEAGDGVYTHHTIDQIANVISQIKHNPFSRRHIVTAWNPAEIDQMALPPCHAMFQFYVTPDDDGNPDTLSCQLYQRSADIFLGVPFNIASYAALIHMVAQVCDLRVGKFVHTLGDAHIYLNHLEQVDLLLSRDFLPAPTLVLNQDVREIDGFELDDIRVVDYNHHGVITAPISV